MLQDLNSTLKENLEQKERLCESLRKEIEQERRRSSQLEMLLNASHQLQVIYDHNINDIAIFISMTYNLQAKKQEKGKGVVEKQGYIPGRVSN